VKDVAVGEQEISDEHCAAHSQHDGQQIFEFEKQDGHLQMKVPRYR
jgi:hypothetical protein